MNNVVPIVKQLSKPEAQKIIRELASNGCVSWSRHSKERMEQRGITTVQVLNCLEKGTVKDDPYFSHENGGGYVTKIERGCAGDWLRVVVSIKLNEKVLVITVYGD